MAVAETPNWSSVSTSCVVATPVMWTSWPSISGSTFSIDSTGMQAPSPSSRALAVLTLLPSFQNRTGKPITNRASPASTPFIELPSLEPHETVVVSVTAIFASFLL